jgi:hypothetical protein
LTSGSIGVDANSGRSSARRDVDHREGADRLRLPVLEHLEVFLLQIADVLALLVGDDDVDLDVVDRTLKVGCCGCGRRWRR